MPARGRSKGRRRSESKPEGLQLVMNNVARGISKVEKTIDKEIVDKYLKEENIAYAKQNARIYAESFGKTVADELCPAQMSVITDGKNHSNIYGNRSIYGDSTFYESPSKAVKQLMIEKTDARRSEIKNALSREATFPWIDTSKKKNYQRRSVGSDYGSENKRLKEELKSASASFAKLEANKIKMNEKHNKTLKSVLTEMVKAEKKFKKERALFEDTKRSLMKKLRIKHERVEKLEASLSRIDTEANSREEISRLRTEINDEKEKSLGEKERHRTEVLDLKKIVADQKVIISGLTEEGSRLKNKLIELKNSSSLLMEDTLEERRIKDGEALKEQKRLAEELEDKNKKIVELEMITVKKDEELEDQRNNILKLRARVDVAQNTLDEQLTTKEKLIVVQKINSEQRDKISELTVEISTLKEKISTLIKENNALNANEGSTHSEQSNTTNKRLIDTLMREIYSLSIENGSLQQELKNISLNDTTAISSYGDDDDQQSHQSSSHQHFTENDESEIQKMKEHIIKTIDKEISGSFDESIETEADIHNVSLAIMGSSENSIRTKDQGKPREDNSDNFSDDSSKEEHKQMNDVLSGSKKDFFPENEERSIHSFSGDSDDFLQDERSSHMNEQKQNSRNCLADEDSSHMGEQEQDSHDFFADGDFFSEMNTVDNFNDHDDHYYVENDNFFPGKKAMHDNDDNNWVPFS